MTAAAAAAPARSVLDALADLLRRHGDGADVDQLLDELATVLRRGRAAVRRTAARKDGGRDCAPTAAVKHPGIQQETRPEQVRGAAADTPMIATGTSHLGAKSAPSARVRVGDDSGGRGTNPAAAPTTPPVPARTQDTERDQATGRVGQVQGVSPAGKPATATPALVAPARSVTAKLVAVPGLEPGPPLGAPPATRTVARRPDEVPLALHREPPSVRGRGWLRPAFVGLGQLAALVAGLLVVLLCASSAGLVAPDDVVPATAVGAALLAGLLVGRATAPAVLAAITRLRRRARTVAPTRAAT